MSSKDSWRAATMARMLEGTAATVIGGMIVWYVTSSMSQRALPPSSPPPALQRLAEPSIPSLQASAGLNDLSSAGLEAIASPAPSINAGLPLSSEAGPPAAAGELRATALQDPVPIASAPRDTVSNGQETNASPLTMPGSSSSPLALAKEPPQSITAPSPPATERELFPATADNRLPPPPTTEPVAAMATARKATAPASAPASTVVFYEDFSRYREGEATAWGQDTVVKLGLDGRKWMVAQTEGTHTVGRGLRLPGEFSFDCRYSAHMVEVTRGLLGWWKDPLASRIAFLDDRGGRFVIEWVVACGSDSVRLNPLGPPPENTYYHTLKFSGTAAGEVRVPQPSGTLRITRNKNLVNVFINGQGAGAVTIASLGQLVGFEIDVVKTKNAAMSFTDFKITR